MGATHGSRVASVSTTTKSLMRLQVYKPQASKISSTAAVFMVMPAQNAQERVKTPRQTPE
jgi:hypothetical protein